MARRSPLPQPPWLPTTRSELEALGWEGVDILLVTGDAYVDHPAYGVPLLGRWLVHHGFRVGIIPQPRWTEPTDVARLGRPRLWAGVSAGTLDSSLAAFTAFRRPRRDDPNTPGGRAGARPARASLVYANLLRQAFPGLYLVLGGLEASLRRVTHYDFWSDGLRRSLLLDAKADLLVYGMAEQAVLELSCRLAEEAGGGAVTRAGAGGRGLAGTAWVGETAEVPAGASLVELPAHEAILQTPRLLLDATLALERQVHQGRAWCVQRSGERLVVLAPPAPPLTTAELDLLYGLPFSRQPHPSHQDPIPAMQLIGTSITAHRGCGGGCSFCSLAAHQGRIVVSRSRASILAEVELLAKSPDFSGSITDVGGPTANMWGATCQGDRAHCIRTSCLVPTRCRHFAAPQAPYLALLEEVARRVRHVRVGSGLRHDLALQEPEVAQALVRRFVGGQLKLAPEHQAPEVLRLMRKPGFELFERFLELFTQASAAAGREQYVVPYLMSAFPGCTEAHMTELAHWLHARGWRPQQVQCFVPTPGTVATAMFHAGLDPAGQPLHVARTDQARRRQHELLMGLTRPRPERRSTPPRPRGRTRVRRAPE